jgi:hypothetical protein
VKVLMYIQKTISTQYMVGIGKYVKKLRKRLKSYNQLATHSPHPTVWLQRPQQRNR